MDEAGQDAASSLPEPLVSVPAHRGAATPQHTHTPVHISQTQLCGRHALPRRGKWWLNGARIDKEAQWPVCLTLDVEEDREE